MHVHPYKLLTKGYYRVRNSFYANFHFKKIITLKYGVYVLFIKRGFSYYFKLDLRLTGCVEVLWNELRICRQLL